MSRTLLIALALVSLVGGCEKEDETETSASGPKDCTAYIAALEACIEKLPEAQRAPMQKVLDARKLSLKNADRLAKSQMRADCRTGLATLKQDKRCK